ncbi:SRPBCC family protein [Mucilaginibacter terrae]|uniref:Ligand-binding SRPBCC domain-containing protein n=1 Tax=Mucilaginibacter terrae TaxID=1955052 RepID=A0ABU3GUF2_9SPHI|nr:SRPBCC family protein [Mucilaginibacter terrae]MDT3402592.1 ligand-binding SRPBCC domain-containing protein [Mucilaginibacter terrae]
MPVIKLQTHINASVEDCFNLSRNIDLHQQSMQQFNEQAVAGITTGQIGLHDTVTWKARHFGFTFKMTVQITEMQSPSFFVDEMVKGPFTRMRHYHAFWPQPNGTLMEDEFVYKSPLGWLGKIADKLIVTKHLQLLLAQRNQTIKLLAESNTAVMAVQS